MDNPIGPLAEWEHRFLSRDGFMGPGGVDSPTLNDWCRIVGQPVEAPRHWSEGMD